MGAHTNIWSPDTCDCSIEFEFDDAVSANERVHIGKRIIKRCPAHQPEHFTDCHDHYNSVLSENQRKNILLGKLIEAHPEISKTLDNGAKVLREDIDYVHSFTGVGKNRVLDVNLVDKKEIPDFILQKKHRDSINKIAKETFGEGKVAVK